MGQLFELIDQADAGLLSDLGRALGLKQDKVIELQQNARTVAREDSRKRVWGSPDFPSDRLVYPCEGGAVDLLREHIGESAKLGCGSAATLPRSSERNVDTVLCFPPV